MVMAMSLTAFAADPEPAYNTATITVSGLTEGDTLKLYRIFAATVAPDNTITYTAEGWVPEKYNTVEKLTAAAADADSAKAVANDLVENALEMGPVAYSINANGSQSVAAGYYFGMVSANTTSVYQNMLINAVMTANSNNSYDPTNVDLKMKSTEVTVDKDVTGATDDSDVTDAYKVGDYVPFTVTTAIPNYPANAYNTVFVFRDRPTNLNIVNDDAHKVVVTVNGKEVAASNSTYTANVYEGEGLYMMFDTSFVLNNAGAPVVITYFAQITDAAATSVTKNDAMLTYAPDPYSSSTYDIKDIVTVNTYGYVFEKVGKDNAPLAGATFTLYSDEKCTTPVTKADGTTAMTSTSAIVNGKAYVYFNGLKAGTYYVKETTVPAGYVASENFSFTLSSTTAIADNPATTDVTENNYLVKESPVVNTPGAELPTTGGIGTTIFYAVGAILVIGAGLVLVTRRRMSI
jgi:fimbrial isopeptide formation D2 family protein/LPXTG-motif cell wall-anchored protein